MSRFSILLSRSIFTGMAAIFATSTAAHAESQTYRGSGFTVTFTSDDKGYHYHGCDSKNNCVDLDNGSRWRDNGEQGVFWFSENGNYTYGISHNSDASIRLDVAKGTKKLMRLKLFPITARVQSQNSTTCRVTNIQSGQLALRNSPAGQSLAGLDNGNSVLLKRKQNEWAYVHVLQTSSQEVNNLNGWVNSNYLACE